MQRFNILFIVIITLLTFNLSNSYAQTSNTTLFIQAKQKSINNDFNGAAALLKEILKNEKSMYVYDFLIENLLNGNMVDDALETSKQASKDFPKEAKYLNLISSIYKIYKNDIKAAYEYMEQALLLSNSKEYMLNTAMLATATGNYKRADELLNKLIKESGENSMYYLSRADNFIAQNKTRQAEKDLEKAISIDNNITAKLMLAEIYLSQKKDDKAVTILEEVAKENENISSIIEQNIGKIYTDSGNFDKAIDVYKRLADKLYGKSKAIILMQLGDVLNRAGKYKEAGAVFEEITLLMPNDTMNYYISGKFYEYTKEYEKAKKMYLGALKINPLYAQVLKRLTVVYLLQNKTADALKYINMVDELEQDVDYFLLKAECYTLDKNFKEAIKILESGLKDNPTNPQILSYLASLYEEVGDNEKALDFIKKALELEPDNHIFQNFLGYMYAEMNINLNEALKLVEKALKQEPENAAYLDSLGWVYYKMKDYKKAYKYISKAVSIMPEEQELIDHLNHVKKAMGK